MSQKQYFSYVRVSTQKQGQLGTSLAEQQGAIDRYCQTWNLKIVKCFEEQETAAKQGRPVFLEMLKALRQGKACGLVIHKIDRGARNLKDWADLGSLIDAGLEVHFANESLDLNTRGGRLSADIQAVVAADYVRNLREEVKKGFYGRLKQGFYPMPAPLGYLDVGKGEPKQIDPERGPLIKKAFELYSTGQVGLIALTGKMFELGLRNKNGKRVTITGFSGILHNSFYIGLIKIRKTDQIFAGRHRPLITRALYNKVQAVFEGKFVKKTERHFFTFRRQINCRQCRNLLVAERQKGHVYYRCHTRNCSMRTIREEVIDKEVLRTFAKLRLNEAELRYFKKATITGSEASISDTKAKTKQWHLQLSQIKDRQSKLADAYVEQIFDKEIYIQKKNELLLEELAIKDRLSVLSKNADESIKRLEAFLELLDSAYLSYEIGIPEEKRELIKMMTSNFLAEGKSVSIKLELPFQMMAERQPFIPGAPQRDATRTLRPLFKRLLRYFKDLDTSKGDNEFLNYVTSKQEEKIRTRFPRLSH